MKLNIKYLLIITNIFRLICGRSTGRSSHVAVLAALLPVSVSDGTGRRDRKEFRSRQFGGHPKGRRYATSVPPRHDTASDASAAATPQLEDMI